MALLYFATGETEEPPAAGFAGESFGPGYFLLSYTDLEEKNVKTALESWGTEFIHVYGLLSGLTVVYEITAIGGEEGESWYFEVIPISGNYEEVSEPGEILEVSETSGILEGEAVAEIPLDSTATGPLSGEASTEMLPEGEASAPSIKMGEASAELPLEGDSTGLIAKTGDTTGELSLETSAGGDFTPTGKPEPTEVPLEPAAEGEKTEPVVSQSFTLEGNILYDT